MLDISFWNILRKLHSKAFISKTGRTTRIDSKRRKTARAHESETVRENALKADKLRHKNSRLSENHDETAERLAKVL
jgi:hypothetical protein